jgi:hypothetical protein
VSEIPAIVKAYADAARNAIAAGFDGVEVCGLDCCLIAVQQHMCCWSAHAKDIVTCTQFGFVTASKKLP